jgi:outer membrane protein assembly factor BamD
MKQAFFFILLAVGLLQGCSNYNSVVRSDDFDRKFELANELYDRKQYARCISLYEQVYQRMPKTGQGEISYYRIGKSYFALEDYLMGGYYFSSMPEKFPMSNKNEETMFLGALCAVKNSPDYTLDQNDTELALNDLQMFINRYPGSVLIDTCNIIMDQLRFKLEKKEFESVKLYAKMDNFKSAATTAETFLTKFPKSIFREEAYFILVKNSYLLTVNSIETKKLERIEKSIERYLTFVTEFPNTSYRKEIDSYHEKLNEDLFLITNTQK